MREFCVKAKILTVEELEKLNDFLLNPPRNRYYRFHFGRITGVELDSSRYSLTLYMTDGVDYFRVIIWMNSDMIFMFNGKSRIRYTFKCRLSDNNDSGLLEGPICQWQIVKSDLELKQLLKAVKI